MTTKDKITSGKPVQKRRKEPDIIEKHLMCELLVPTEEIWDREFEEFKFTDEQRCELEKVLYHLREDISDYNKKTRETGLRSENKRRLVELEKSLAKTRYFLERYQDGMDNWLPFDLREEIGLLSNFIFAEEQLEVQTYSARIDREIIDAAYQQRPLLIKDIEDKLIASRKSIGLLAGHRILLKMVQRLHEPLRKWRILERSNKGGTPADKTMRAVVYWLAWSAPGILGRKAAKAKTGPFVKLCAAVLRACGAPNESVGDSVPDIVTIALADKAGHEAAMTGPGNYIDNP